MTLGSLLAALDARGLTVTVRAGGPVVRGGGLDDVLRAALAEHREHLVRLCGGNLGTSWRRALARADADTREAWCYLVAGYDAQGCTRQGAEWLAWDRLEGMAT